MLTTLTTIVFEVVERVITTLIVNAARGKQSSITIHELHVHISNELDKYSHDIVNADDMYAQTLYEIREISKRLDHLELSATDFKVNLPKGSKNLSEDVATGEIEKLVDIIRSKRQTIMYEKINELDDERSGATLVDWEEKVGIGLADRIRQRSKGLL